MHLLDAMTNRCDRCRGSHLSTLHGPREAAAASIARGETTAQAAAASGMSKALVDYWAQADAEFRAQVELARGGGSAA